jgi:predicted transcriptional regulator of viral defense system
MRTLGPKGAKLIHSLVSSNKMLFTIRDAMEITGNSYKATEELLRRLLDRRWLTSIKNGKYAVLPLETGMTGFNPYNWFVIARELVDPELYYVSYYSAMSIHNMITQPLNTIYIASPVRRRNTNIAEAARVKFVYTNQSRFWGIVDNWVTSQDQVRVSDLERTIIDCLWIPKYCGGISEIAKGIWMRRDDIDYVKLYEYANRFAKTVVSKRLGFVLETYEIDKDGIVALLRKDSEKHKSYPVLDPLLPPEGKYRKSWYLKININPEELRAVVRT